MITSLPTFEQVSHNFFFMDDVSTLAMGLRISASDDDSASSVEFLSDRPAPLAVPPISATSAGAGEFHSAFSSPMSTVTTVTGGESLLLPEVTYVWCW